MKIKVLSVCLWAFVLTVSANAYVHCANLDIYQEELSSFSLSEQISLVTASVVLQMADQCSQATGSDNVFKLHQAEFDYEHFCGKSSDSKNGYVKIVMECNFCKGVVLQNDLVFHESFCNAQCLQKNKQCIMAPNLWGGEIKKINPNGGECGAPLPNCSVSSSSETIESSSSEEPESSSSEDDVESSSSEDFDLSSSSELLFFSSSDTEDDFETCAGEVSEIECYNNSNEGSCGPANRFIFKKRPALVGDIKLYNYKPYCDNGKIVFSANIPIVYFSAGSFSCLKEGCFSYHSIEGFWECNEGFQQVNGCSVVPAHRSIEFYYSVLAQELRTSWGAVDFSSLPESDVSLPCFDVNELLNLVAKTGVEARGDDGREDLRVLYPHFSINSFDDYVNACAYHLNIDISSSSEALSSSSSFAILASSSSVQSSSSEESSSSVEESSSSYEDSSSSMEYEESSSSEKIESSSSFDGETLYSSTQVESSGSEQIESSSSEFVYSSSDDGVFVAGGDQVHSPEQIIRDGLDNMEDGKCYSLNPARGTQYGWMNTDAQDSWWWREVDCETGEKVDRNRVGACPGFPLDNVPSNPKRSCIAYNGKCYRCKYENNYVDCSQEWLWKWMFNVQNIGTWYAEVDCNNPAYVGRHLYKIAEEFNSPSERFDKPADIAVKKVYDAMGRRKSIRDSEYDRKPLYRR